MRHGGRSEEIAREYVFFNLDLHLRIGVGCGDGGDWMAVRVHEKRREERDDVPLFPPLCLTAEGWL